MVEMAHVLTQGTSLHPGAYRRTPGMGPGFLNMQGTNPAGPQKSVEGFGRTRVQGQRPSGEAGGVGQLLV